MARKKKGDSGSIIFFIVIVVLVAIALATPIALIIGYLYNKINAGRIKKYISGNMSDFWLDDQEKIEFKDKLKHLVKADKIIDQANQKGIDEGVSRNKDGSFSAKSKIGKEIRAALEKYEPIKDSLSEYLYDLQHLPITRWDEFNKYIKRSKSSIYSFCSWCAVLIYYFLNLGKKSILDIFLPYLALATNIFRDKENQLPLADGDIQMVAVATIIAIVMFFVFGLIFKSSGAKYSPYPEKVTLENVDSY
jgi:hypothetical protein